MAPYEKRIVELLKIGKDKRALKVAKRKVRRRCRGLHSRRMMVILHGRPRRRLAMHGSRMPVSDLSI